MTDQRIEKLARAMADTRFGDPEMADVPGFRYWAGRALAAIDEDPPAYGLWKEARIGVQCAATRADPHDFSGSNRCVKCGIHWSDT